MNEPDAGGNIHVVAQSEVRTDGTLPSTSVACFLIVALP
jgi:hypothetical protein